MPFWRTSAEWEWVWGYSGRGSARFRITEFPVGLCPSLKSHALSSRCEWAQTKASACLGMSTAVSLVNWANARGEQSWDLDIQRKCCACKWLPWLCRKKQANKQTNKQTHLGLQYALVSAVSILSHHEWFQAIVMPGFLFIESKNEHHNAQGR